MGECRWYIIVRTMTGMVDKDFETATLTEKNLVQEPVHAQYQFLPLDTRHLPDLELDILALFDDLDAALDGWLVHSENYQALNAQTLWNCEGQCCSSPA